MQGLSSLRSQPLVGVAQLWIVRCHQPLQVIHYPGRLLFQWFLQVGYLSPSWV